MILDVVPQQYQVKYTEVQPHVAPLPIARLSIEDYAKMWNNCNIEIISITGPNEKRDNKNWLKRLFGL